MRKLAKIALLLVGFLFAAGLVTANSQPAGPDRLQGGAPGQGAGASGGAGGGASGAPAPGAGGRLAGEWNGKYVCAQGVTGLHIILAESGVANATALIHFFPLPENPKAAEGCFTASGWFDPASGNFNLQQQRWVMQPPRYLMADVRGKLDASGEMITGSLVGPPNCSLFFLARGAGIRPLPGRCQPR
jgi:hypothetical protein